MTPISVFIITKNEADRIGKIIQSVKSFAEEIIIIDSGSTDETKKICEDLQVKFIFNAWRGYGPQKIFGENICKNQWLFNIDADEEVSPELANEIKEIFSQEIQPEVAGFRVKIVNKFRFETKPHRFAYFYNQLRLYNKNLAGFKNSTVHDSVILKDSKNKILQLKNIIYHQSFRDFSHWVDKINSYSTMQAKDSVLKNKKASFFKILLAPTLAFFKAFFVRRYFIYGFNGIIYSYLYAFSRFLKMVKTREEFEAIKFKNNHE